MVGDRWIGFGWRCGRMAAVAAVAAACVAGGEAEQGRPGPAPYLAQARAQSCLVAATAMALGAFGVAETEDRLWAEVRSWGEGTSVFEVQDALAARGFEGLAFRSTRAELEAIVDAGYPVIAVVGWPQKHAIVVAGRDAARGTVRLHDPKAGGPTDEAVEAFDARWAATGREVFLVLRRGDDRLAPAGVDLGRMRDETGRARATEWSLRALLRSGAAVAER